ncbi:MAG TPA: hypothetical protein VMJ75_10305 [Candidatus Acidoferrales bacterium]|nr:hypothetical protein [Candidatus Acidoferrales bacterium]
MASSVHFGGLPISSDILTRGLRQFQLAGLLCGAVGIGGSDRRIHGIWQHYVPLSFALSLAETRDPAGFAIEDAPVVYNPGSWHQQALCGRAGRDLKLDPADLLTGYMECWLLGVRNEDAAADHFVKCLLWFFESRGRRLDDALAFLADLHEAGLVVSGNLLLAIVTGFWAFYARNADLSFMKASTMADRDRLNRELGRLRRELHNVPPSQPKLHAVIDWFIDYGLNLAAQAKGARTLDEWLIARARMVAPYSAMSQWFAAAGELGLTLTQRTSLSQIDEIAQDLVSEFGMFRLRADQHLPLAWDLDLVNAVGKEYRRHHSREEWLDRVVEERVAAPEAVRKIVMQAGAVEPGEATVPQEWRICTEAVAVPLCLVLGREAWSFRSRDFGAEPLTRAAADAGGDVPAARRELARSETEFYASLIALPQASFRLDLDEARLRYPWHAFFSRSSGMAKGLDGALDAALPEIESALLMELRDPGNWAALARGAELTRRAGDSEFLNSVAAGLIELSGGQK